MERKGAYNKGSAGHVRNASAYRIFKEKFKKWRGPTITAFVLVLAFGLTPYMGSDVQTSVLTAGETAQLVDTNPAEARKNIVAYHKDIIDQCQTFLLADCVDEGGQIMTAISNEALDVRMALTAVVDFEQKTLDARAKAACKYEAPKYLNELKAVNEKMAAFSDTYSLSTPLGDISDQVTALESQAAKLEATLKTCSQ